MEIFDALNQYLLTHPHMMEDLAFAFRLKFWCFLFLAGLMFYFATADARKHEHKDEEPRRGWFIA
ncbi:MAG: hypothetical protein V3U75_14285 [Methylococcaceae bacterium]